MSGYRTRSSSATGTRRVTRSSTLKSRHIADNSSPINSSLRESTKSAVEQPVQRTLSYEEEEKQVYQNGYSKIYEEDNDAENQEGEEEEEEEEENEEQGYLNGRYVDYDEDEEFDTAKYSRKKKSRSNWTKSLRPRRIAKKMKRFWRSSVYYLLFAINALWLLLPVGCFILAIVIPQHLTNLIRFAPVLSPVISNTNTSCSTLDKSTMRTMISDILDVRMSSMKGEMDILKTTIASQEQEVETLRELQQSIKDLHQDYIKRFDVLNPKSQLALHIDRIITKQVETLRTSYVDIASTVENSLRQAATQQASVIDDLQSHREQLASLREKASKALNGVAALKAATTNTPAESNSTGGTAQLQATNEQFENWKDQVLQELQFQVGEAITAAKKEFATAIAAVSSSTSKQPPATPPAQQVIAFQTENDKLFLQTAVKEIIGDVQQSSRQVQRADHAALVNGATVVHSERDLFFPDEFYLIKLFYRQTQPSKEIFTSTSFRRPPLFNALWSQETWWLSRHNGRPETALSETMEIGSCWSLVGKKGKLSIRFTQKILPDAFTMDHVLPESVTDFSSAPKDFSVVGLIVEKDKINSEEAVHIASPLFTIRRVPLGNFTYRKGEEGSQTFSIPRDLAMIPIDAVTLEIKSNYGNPSFTCLYRFRVHGEQIPNTIATSTTPSVTGIDTS